jgi:hypothetical protein
VQRLQAYIVTMNYLAQSRLVLSKILPGQGKTYSMMLLALLYRSKFPKKKVLFLTTDEMLKE